MLCFFYQFHLSFEYYGIYYTNSGSNKITEIYWSHTTTLYVNKSSFICHLWHSRFCKLLHQRLVASRPSTRRHAIWWTTQPLHHIAMNRRLSAVRRVVSRTTSHLFRPFHQLWCMDSNFRWSQPHFSHCSRLCAADAGKLIGRIEPALVVYQGQVQSQTKQSGLVRD